MRLASFLSLVATGAAVVLTGLPASAQLTDLQPGRNFTSVNNFGTGRSENIDVGDADNDGDLDAVVANGGDGAAQANKLYINNGGLQGGTLGTFSDQSATRFAGVPNDTSRDCEFMDADNDGDLDVYISNRGTTINGGEPSRFYTNLGGLQGGTVGFYQEQTDFHWGSLASVPAGDQVLGGNQGPFRDFTCDCDFADLDDDGDNDLFHSSYGPNIDGTRDSRIFLNDGNGVFNELWPWVNAAADNKNHTLDMDIIDFDGDFDLDIFMSSRNSQARVFMSNRVNPVGAQLYSDITQFALIAQGATLVGQNNYEAEPADLDGDGDMDVWVKNYANNGDRILINQGFTPGQGFKFISNSSWIKGDPNQDENEVDFIDYDNDGDLDPFVANFSGTNTLYQSGLAQGLNPSTQGLYHRTGVSGGGSLASAFGELPSNYNSGQSLDGEVGDADNDGDEDLWLANDANQQNRLFVNQLGVPDTHAPAFFNIEDVADKANGTETAVHVMVNDNTAFYLHAYETANLVYSVNGGPATTVSMFYQGGQMFRGVIPAQNDSAISYHIEVTDWAGNTGVTGEYCFAQGNAPDSWTGLGGGLAGTNGIPSLTGAGSLAVGCDNTLSLSSAKAGAVAILWVSFADNPSPFKGGILHTVPIVFNLPFVTSGAGGFVLPFSWPSGVPSGFDLYFQIGVQDAAAVKGTALSTYVKGTTL